MRVFFLLLKMILGKKNSPLQSFFRIKLIFSLVSIGLVLFIIFLGSLDIGGILGSDNIASSNRGDLSSFTVLKTIDGDTIIVRGEDRMSMKLRLRSIDAPELSQKFGRQARNCLIDIIDNKKIQVHIYGKDQYKRSISDLYVSGDSVNLMLVERGCAWFYKQYSRSLTSKQRRHYINAQNSAKNSKNGLWTNSNPIPPWKWRRLHR